MTAVLDCHPVLDRGAGPSPLALLDSEQKEAFKAAYRRLEAHASGANAAQAQSLDVLGRSNPDHFPRYLRCPNGAVAALYTSPHGDPIKAVVSPDGTIRNHS